MHPKAFLILILILIVIVIFYRGEDYGYGYDYDYDYEASSLGDDLKLQASPRRARRARRWQAGGPATGCAVPVRRAGATVAIMMGDRWTTTATTTVDEERIPKIVHRNRRRSSSSHYGTVPRDLGARGRELGVKDKVER